MTYDEYKNLTDAELLTARAEGKLTTDEYNAEMIDRHGAPAPVRARLKTDVQLAAWARQSIISYGTYREIVQQRHPEVRLALAAYPSRPGDRDTTITAPRRV